MRKNVLFPLSIKRSPDKKDFESKNRNVFLSISLDICLGVLYSTVYYLLDINKLFTHSVLNYRT